MLTPDMAADEHWMDREGAVENGRIGLSDESKDLRSGAEAEQAEARSCLDIISMVWSELRVESGSRELNAQVRWSIDGEVKRRIEEK